VRCRRSSFAKVRQSRVGTLSTAQSGRLSFQTAQDIWHEAVKLKSELSDAVAIQDFLAAARLRDGECLVCDLVGVVAVADGGIVSSQRTVRSQQCILTS
jgi:hypothetical protein